MSTLKSRIAAQGDPVDPRTALAVMGYEPWDQRDIEAYMTRKLRLMKIGLPIFGLRTLPLLTATMVGMVIGVRGFIEMQSPGPAFVGLTIYLVTLCLYYQSNMHWQTNDVFAARGTFLYYRNHHQESVPAPIARIIRTITDAIPAARFRVSFVGSDPVLWCTIGSNRFAVAVWDEPLFGEIRMISRPKS